MICAAFEPIAVLSGVLVRLFCFLLILSLFSLQARSNNIVNSETPQIVVQAPLNERVTATITAAELQETTPAEIRDLLTDPKTSGSDILVTTDQSAVVSAVQEATSSARDRRLVRFLPIGQLARARDRMAAGFSEYYRNARSTLTSDRIGLTVLTITTGVDSFIWIHSTSLDLQQKTSMVLMNIVMAAAFGLDRDLWTRTTSPLKNRIINTLSRFTAPERFTAARTLTGQLIANMTLAVGVQATRLGLLSLDTLSTAVMTTDFWSTAIRIGGLATLTGFAWTEMFGAVDAQRNPVAKMMLKRIGEMRGLILCQLASISMVLQPQVYGNLPVITFVVHGAIGIIVLANTHRIVNWLETNETVRRIYRRVESFENFINNGIRLRPPRSNGPSCRSLFAS